MNIEICKKCTGCDDLVVDFYNYKTVPNTIHFDISVLSDPSVNLYHRLCFQDVYNIPEVDKFEDIDPDKLIKPTCKYLIEHFLEYES